MTAVDSARSLRPASLAEAHDVVGDDGNGALLFRGAGTKLDWAAPPAQVDSVVRTTALDRLLAHDPGDSTARVQAGMPLARLQQALAQAGQWLAIDPPVARDGATVGGILAANDAGPRRLRYGSMRDLVIGLTVVLPDGAVGRSGGTVIKNVAGYDLGKLYCGSLGTLGLIAEVVLRLHPLPEASATLLVDAPAQRAQALTLALLASAVEPTAIDWLGAGGGRLLVRLEGHEAAVTAQAGAVQTLAGDHGCGDAETVRDEAERGLWQDHEVDLAGAEGETTVRGGTLPSQLDEAAAALQRAAEDAGVDASLTSHAGLGLHTARLRGADAAAHASCVQRWRQRLTAMGGHAVVRRRVAGLDDNATIWGPEPSGITLMRRVKQRFDPQVRCAPGRFVGGI